MKEPLVSKLAWSVVVATLSAVGSMVSVKAADEIWRRLLKREPPKL